MTNKKPNQGKIPAGKPRDQTGQRQAQNPDKLPGRGNKTDREDPGVQKDDQLNH